jgi:hypothetical protein
MDTLDRRTLLRRGFSPAAGSLRSARSTRSARRSRTGRGRRAFRVDRLGQILFLNQQGDRGSLPGGPPNLGAVTYAIWGPWKSVN